MKVVLKPFKNNPLINILKAFLNINPNIISSKKKKKKKKTQILNINVTCDSVRAFESLLVWTKMFMDLH